MKKNLLDIIKAFGIVFGDIGTSPIYTVSVIFLTLPKTPENIMGVMSLIIWTLIIIVSLEYTWLAMSLSKNGEGGTIVLKEILLPLLKSGRQVAFFTLLAIFGISLLVGDGVITPAISILSAVEGVVLIPGLHHTPQWILIAIACFIAIGLFSFQKKGAGKVAKAFGPIMVVWFIVLAVFGMVSIYWEPRVLLAISPLYGLKFLFHNGLAGFFVLSEVILCATGGEALYADMGHLGRKPIIRAWSIVFVVLCINYLGQGAFLLRHSNAQNILFSMFYNLTGHFYVLLLILSIIATIIASQAMISGMFSIAYQAITTRIMPMFKVEYTSTELRSQVYIQFINWFMLGAVIFIMIIFRQSSNLASAYGLAVTGDMLLTSVFMVYIFYKKNNLHKTLITLAILMIDVLFLVSNSYKIPHGGYWSLVIASLPFMLILLFTTGQKKLYLSMHPTMMSRFLVKYKELYQSINKIAGTGLFFAMAGNKVSPYIVNTMFINNIIYEDNIFISIIKNENPTGVEYYFKEPLALGLRVFEIKMGYMEFINIEDILENAGIDCKAIFYGLEHITTPNPIWKIFSSIKRLVPSFDEFYELPQRKLHGVITRVKM